MEEPGKTEAETPMGEIKAPIQVEGVKSTRQVLISSPEFSVIERDILRLALDGDKEYTVAGVQKAIDEFKERF